MEYGSKKKSRPNDTWLSSRHIGHLEIAKLAGGQENSALTPVVTTTGKATKSKGKDSIGIDRQADGPKTDGHGKKERREKTAIIIKDWMDARPKEMGRKRNCLRKETWKRKREKKFGLLWQIGDWYKKKKKKKTMRRKEIAGRNKN